MLAVSRGLEGSVPRGDVLLQAVVIQHLFQHDAVSELPHAPGQLLGPREAARADWDAWRRLFDVTRRYESLFGRFVENPGSRLNTKLYRRTFLTPKSYEGATDGRVIVNTSSIAGLAGLHNSTAYTASKHGVVGLTKAAAPEVAGRGVRVNAICPGPVQTLQRKV